MPAGAPPEYSCSSDPALPAEVLGYYTLAALSLAQGDVPAGARERLPRYPQAALR